MAEYLIKRMWTGYPAAADTLVDVCDNQAEAEEEARRLNRGLDKRGFLTPYYVQECLVSVTPPAANPPTSHLSEEELDGIIELDMAAFL